MAIRNSMQDGRDSIVCDREMLEMSGLEITRDLRRSKRGASVFNVLLTGARE